MKSVTEMRADLCWNLSFKVEVCRKGSCKLEKVFFGNTLSFSISKAFMLFDKLQVTVKPWEERTGRLKLLFEKRCYFSTVDLSQRGREQLYTQTTNWDTHSHSTSHYKDIKSILTSLLRTLVSHKNILDLFKAKHPIFLLGCS